MLGALAGAATVRWLARDRPVVSAARVWAGAPITVRFGDAEAFALVLVAEDGATIATSTIDASDGTARFFTPDPPAPGLYALTCTPICAGRPCGAPAGIEVVRTRRVFGA